MIVAGVKDALYPVADCRAVAEKVKTLGYAVKYAEYPEGESYDGGRHVDPGYLQMVRRATHGAYSIGTGSNMVQVRVEVQVKVQVRWRAIPGAYVRKQAPAGRRDHI